MWPQTEPERVPFNIHVFTQNSVKAAKAVNSANWGSLGNRSCPISSFINQSALQDLDAKQCHWSGTPSISSMQMRSACSRGSHAYARRPRRISRLSCRNGASVVTARWWPMSLFERTARSEREKCRECRRMEICPSSHTQQTLSWIPCYCSLISPASRCCSHACLCV